MDNMIWVVYTNMYPFYEYEPQIESIWTNKDMAVKAAKEICVTKDGHHIHDYIYVTNLQINSHCPWDSESEIIVIFNLYSKENK